LLKTKTMEIHKLTLKRVLRRPREGIVIFVVVKAARTLGGALDGIRVGVLCWRHSVHKP
jgi:hypothetical protein